MRNTDTSGGTRYSEGKPAGWWYAPLYGLKLVAPLWEAGAAKYAPKDWQSGQSFSTLLDCAMRHMMEVMHHGVWGIDEDTGAYHAAAVAWNMLALLTFMALGRHDLDDCTIYDGVTAATLREAEAAAAWPSEQTVEDHLRIIMEMRTVADPDLDGYVPDGENAHVEGGMV